MSNWICTCSCFRNRILCMLSTILHKNSKCIDIFIVILHCFGGRVVWSILCQWDSAGSEEFGSYSMYSFYCSLNVLKDGLVLVSMLIFTAVLIVLDSISVFHVVIIPDWSKLLVMLTWKQSRLILHKICMHNAGVYSI